MVGERSDWTIGEILKKHLASTLRFGYIVNVTKLCNVYF